MKNYLFILVVTLLSNFLTSQKISENDIMGRWNVVKVSEKIDHPNFKEIEKSFSSAVFEFNADKSFKLTTRSNSKLFSMVKDMTANSKWRLNKDKTIAIGNQSNKYSIMNIIVIAANDKIIFKMSETELNLEVQKE